MTAPDVEALLQEADEQCRQDALIAAATGNGGQHHTLYYRLAAALRAEQRNIDSLTTANTTMWEELQAYKQRAEAAEARVVGLSLERGHV